MKMDIFEDRSHLSVESLIQKNAKTKPTIQSNPPPIEDASYFINEPVYSEGSTLLDEMCSSAGLQQIFQKPIPGPEVKVTGKGNGFKSGFLLQKSLKRAPSVTEQGVCSGQSHAEHSTLKALGSRGMLDISSGPGVTAPKSSDFVIPEVQQAMEKQLPTFEKALASRGASRTLCSTGRYRLAYLRHSID